MSVLKVGAWYIVRRQRRKSGGAVGIIGPWSIACYKEWDVPRFFFRTKKMLCLGVCAPELLVGGRQTGDWDIAHMHMPDPHPIQLMIGHIEQRRRLTWKLIAGINIARGDFSEDCMLAAEQSYPLTRITLPKEIIQIFPVTDHRYDRVLLEAVPHRLR